MSKKIHTRQIKMPRPLHRAVNAEDIKSAAQKDLRPGEELIRVAFVALEGDFLIIEAGFAGGAASENPEPETKKSPAPPAGPAPFKPGQVRSLQSKPQQPRPKT